MDIIASFIICFILFVTGAFKGIFVGYTLLIALSIFMVLAVARGNSIISVIKMVYRGGRKTFIVLQIFMLIGAIISVWMASGTVQSIVYYGLKYINGNLFILSAFIISSLVSVLIGTSFGTIGTVGIALMVMARSGNVSTSATAGAIIAGAYLGDRCSPMSSSANLVALITGTNLYTNIKNMIKTSVFPIIISIIAYTIISFRFPMSASGNTVSNDIAAQYNVGLIAMIPAFIILALSLLKINVKLSMLISVASAVVLSILIQKNSALQTLKYIFLGYNSGGNSYLSKIITGGGVLSMLKVSLVVFISSGFTGIFEATDMLKTIEDYTSRAKSRSGLFFTTIIVSLVTAAFGCTQVMAVMLTHMLMKKSYDGKKVSSEELALDLEDTAIIIAPLIPWNIALLVPLTSLNAGLGAIPFCLYLYILPMWNLAARMDMFKKKIIS